VSFAASNTTIVFQQFGAFSPTAILSNLIAIFEAAGWTLAGPISGGVQFIIQSPPSQSGLPSQNLGARVNVFIDPNFSISGIPQVGIQLLSLDLTTHNLGFIHHLQAVPGRTLQVWANVCQFFISQPGIAINTSGNALCNCAGGIPYVPSSAGSCGVSNGPQYAKEAWWSGGDEDQSNGTNFRFTYVCNMFSACYNGDLMVSANFLTYTDRAKLRLLPEALCVPIGHTFQSNPRTRWFGGGSMFFDPLIMWGSGSSSNSLGLVRGQLWDSFIVSTQQKLDLQTTIAELTYTNYTEDTDPVRGGGDQSLSRYMSLFLLMNIPTNAGFNYMY
jgi:hypothetical protein